MKRIALLGLMLLSILAQAQFEEPRDISYTISSPYKVVDAPSKDYFKRGDEVLSLKIVKAKLFAQKFHIDGMKERSRRELSMPKGYALEAVTEFAGRVLIFYSIWDRDRTSEQLFYREIDFESANWKGAQKRIIATRGKIAGSPQVTTSLGFSMGVTDKFDFYFSSEGDNLLVQYRKVPKIKSDAKNHDIIGLYVFDSEVNEIWGDEVKMPYTEKKMNNVDYSVDAKGNAYILATVYDDNTTRTTKKDNKSEPNYHIELLKRAPEERTLDISKIELNGKFITNVAIYETVGDLMALAGFYNNTASGGDAEGIFYAKVDEEGDLYDERSHSIPLEILNQYESKRQQKRNTKQEDKGRSEFASLRLRKLQFLSDGSIILIGEQYYVISHTTTNANGGTSTYYTYHYNDILISKINPEGDLAWMRKLPKSQVGRNGRGMMSFQHFYSAGFHYLMFLDEIENENLPFDQPPRTYGDGKFGHLTAFVIDDERGEVSREVILDMRDAKGMKLYQFKPSKIFRISEDEFMFEAYKKKKEDVMVKISLQE